MIIMITTAMCVHVGARGLTPPTRKKKKINTEFDHATSSASPYSTHDARPPHSTATQVFNTA